MDKIEPRLVDSAFLPNGDQICIWSDGKAFIVNPTRGEKPIGIRKARAMIARAKEGESCRQ